MSTISIQIRERKFGLVSRSLTDVKIIIVNAGTTYTPIEKYFRRLVHTQQFTLYTIHRPPWFPIVHSFIISFSFLFFFFKRKKEIPTQNDDLWQWHSFIYTHWPYLECLITKCHTGTSSKVDLEHKKIILSGMHNIHISASSKKSLYGVGSL